jgi:hypothetical protein
MPIRFGLAKDTRLILSIAAGADLANPPIETVAVPTDLPDLARIADDELKRISEARPDKLPAQVVSLLLYSAP